MMDLLYAGINIVLMMVSLVAGVFIGAYAIIVRQKYRKFKVGLGMVKPAMPFIKVTGIAIVILTIVSLYGIGVLQ
jgi:predicted Co/Zn/Cd cation transporter (cation efflux family)